MEHKTPRQYSFAQLSNEAQCHVIDTWFKANGVTWATKYAYGMKWAAAVVVPGAWKFDNQGNRLDEPGEDEKYT